MRRALLLGVIVGLFGCRATVTTPKAEPETVGKLTPSYNSVAVAPIHHDAPPEMGQVIDTDPEAPVTVTPSVETVEKPETVRKVSHGF